MGSSETEVKIIWRYLQEESIAPLIVAVGELEGGGGGGNGIYYGVGGGGDGGRGDN